VDEVQMRVDMQAIGRKELVEAKSRCRAGCAMA
jgi:hypothetical protein